MSDCLFCKIAEGAIPADVVHRDDDVVAFRDIDPKAPVHILLIPKRHIPSLADADDGDGALLAKILRLAADLAVQEGVDDGGWRLVTNRGGDGGQSVFHLHFHLLGGRPLGWPPG